MKIYKVLSFFDEAQANEMLACAAEEGWTVKDFGTDKHGCYWALMERDYDCKNKDLIKTFGI